MGSSQIRVEACGGALGAEIHGVDLSEPLEDAVAADIYEAWLEHQVIFLREQTITPAQQVAFAAQLGELDVYPFMEPLAEQPEIIPIIKERDTRFNFGGGWHSDTPYQATPPKATMLYAREVPIRGGDTLFANMYAAHDALSPGMRSLISELKGVYSADKVHGKGGFYKNADHPMDMKKNESRATERYEHPIIRTHPETSRKALYVSVPHIERFATLSTEESRPLLDFLGRHATKAEFTHRFQWAKGTLVLWDNRCVQHFALNDYPGERREMHRLTLKGDAPR